MLQPPFKLLSPSAVGARCCEPGAAPHDAIAGALGKVDAADTSADTTDTPAETAARLRLAGLDPNLHCSVIGTCLGTAELRKLMARFIDVQGATDLDVHHDAVRFVAQHPAVAKALQKALDHRHAPVLQRAARLQQADALGAWWDEALRQGEVPGAYWAVLTHRKATPALRQRVFGDVHMLSHLVGAANRADIRRLVALEHDNAELRERLDRQQLRAQELLEERDRRIATLTQQLIDAGSARAEAPPADAVERIRHEEAERAAALIAVQTGRRERAEQASVGAVAEADRLAEELEHLRRHAMALGRKLGAAEAQLRLHAGEAAPSAYLDGQLRGRRLLYVGGRPSSMPAIRDLVQRHGGDFRRHGGSLEDRSGQLAADVAWAELVVFPVDCVDHESVDNLKRACSRQQVRYIPLRSAGIGCFAAAFSAPPATAPVCRR